MVEQKSGGIRLSYSMGENSNIGSVEGGTGFAMALSVSDGVPAVIPGCVQEYSPAVALPGPGANLLMAVWKNRNEAVFYFGKGRK
jgi:hypothetical protein